MVFLKILSLLVITVQMVNAKLFDGGYVGGQISLTQRRDETCVPEAAISKGTTLLILSGIHNHKKNFYHTYGLIGGYGRRFLEKGYGGIEVNFNTHNHISDTIFNYKKCQLNNRPIQPGVILTGPGVSPPSIVEGAATLKANYRRGAVYAVVGRLGMVIQDNILIYGRLGVEYSRDTLNLQYQVRFPGETIKDQSESFYNSCIWVPGVGVEKALGRFLGRLEYNYSPGTTLRHTSQEGEPKITQHMSYKFHMIKIGVMYNF